jgi:hypothetical protein
VEVATSPPAARSEVRRVLFSLARRKAHDRLSLLIDMSEALRVPIHARVPVTLKVKVRDENCGAQSIELVPERETLFFPNFKGRLAVTQGVLGTSELWLQGSFEEPIESVGYKADHTFLHNTCMRGLKALLEWLSLEVRKNIDEAERSQSFTTALNMESSFPQRP